jgi:hypothetical protein
MAISSHAAFAATHHRANRLETIEHRYYDSADRLHIDIRVRHIPLLLRDATNAPRARGGGRHSHARAPSTDVPIAGPAAEPDAIQPDDEAAPRTADSPSGFFTAPGYGPPMPSAAHPMLPMPLAP